MTDLEHILEVLAIFEHADAEDQVFWRVDPSGASVKFYAHVQDFFGWAIADAEPIEPEDLKLLNDCLDELRRYPAALDEVGRLFAARKRQRRPMEAWLLANNDLPSGVLDLFRACGPPTGHYGEG